MSAYKDAIARLDELVDVVKIYCETLVHLKSRATGFCEIGTEALYHSKTALESLKDGRFERLARNNRAECLGAFGYLDDALVMFDGIYNEDRQVRTACQALKLMEKSSKFDEGSDIWQQFPENGTTISSEHPWWQSYTDLYMYE